MRFSVDAFEVCGAIAREQGWRNVFEVLYNQMHYTLLYDSL